MIASESSKKWRGLALYLESRGQDTTPERWKNRGRGRERYREGGKVGRGGSKSRPKTVIGDSGGGREKAKPNGEMGVERARVLDKENS